MASSGVATPEDAAAVVQQAGVDAFVVYSVSDDDPHRIVLRKGAVTVGLFIAGAVLAGRRLARTTISEV